MTPPRMPDHESDEIVDMTPEFTQDEDTQETETVARTPAHLPEGRVEEFEDATAEFASEEDAWEIAERTAPSRKSKPGEIRAKAPAHMPETAPLAEAPPAKRPSARGGSARTRRAALTPGCVPWALCAGTVLR